MGSLRSSWHSEGKELAREQIADTVLSSSKLPMDQRRRALNRTLVLCLVSPSLFGLLGLFFTQNPIRLLFVLGSAPSLLLWKLTGIQSEASIALCSVPTLIVFATPFLYVLVKKKESTPLLVAVAIYSFLTAGLGFVLILSSIF